MNLLFSIYFTILARIHFDFTFCVYFLSYNYALFLKFDLIISKLMMF